MRSHARGLAGPKRCTATLQMGSASTCSTFSKRGLILRQILTVVLSWQRADPDTGHVNGLLLVRSQAVVRRIAPVPWAISPDPGRTHACCKARDNFTSHLLHSVCRVAGLGSRRHDEQDANNG